FALIFLIWSACPPFRACGNRSVEVKGKSSPRVEFHVAWIVALANTSILRKAVSHGKSAKYRRPYSPHPCRPEPAGRHHPRDAGGPGSLIQLGATAWGSERHCRCPPE